MGGGVWQGMGRLLDRSRVGEGGTGCSTMDPVLTSLPANPVLYLVAHICSSDFSSADPNSPIGVGRSLKGKYPLTLNCAPTSIYLMLDTAQVRVGLLDFQCRFTHHWYFQYHAM